MSRLSPFRWLAPAGARSRLSIFIFHRVLPQPDPLLPWEPDARRFGRILRFIGRHFQVLDLASAIARLQRGSLPAAPACITFDDGYLDNLTVAAPILARHQMTATFFIATAFSGGGRMWNDTVIETVRVAPPGSFDATALGLPWYQLSDAASRVAAYEDILLRLKHLPFEERAEKVRHLASLVQDLAGAPLMMSREQVQHLAAQGMAIGGHTHRHPILSRQSDHEAREEIDSNRALLTKWLGVAPQVFAYPNGLPGRDYGLRDVGLVRAAGYVGAVTTGLGAACGRADVFQLPRFTPWSRSMVAFGARSLQNLLRAPLQSGIDS